MLTFFANRVESWRGINNNFLSKLGYVFKCADWLSFCHIKRLPKCTDINVELFVPSSGMFEQFAFSTELPWLTVSVKFLLSGFSSLHRKSAMYFACGLSLG